MCSLFACISTDLHVGLPQDEKPLAPLGVINTSTGKTSEGDILSRESDKD